MITFLDQAFCTMSMTGCGNKDCHRNYTPELRDRNESGVNLPVSMAGFKTEECGYVELRLQPSDGE